MSFDPDKVENFLKMYNKVNHKISGFPGCHGVKLLRDLHQDNVFFTYSTWDSEEDLNNYRNSELFSGVWKETKSYFNDRPQAWSLEIVQFS